MRRSIDRAGELARRNLAAALPDGDRLDARHGREPPVHGLRRRTFRGGPAWWTQVAISLRF